MQAAQRSFRPKPILRAPLVLAILAFSALGANAAQAAITITFNATVTNAFGDLAAPLPIGAAMTGTLELDETVMGVFTPGTVFTRAEMLYTAAVTSAILSVDGNPLSGTGGDVEILDSDGPLGGDDSYEVTAVIDTGTIGAAAPVSFFWNSAYQETEYMLTGSDPLFPPPPIDPASANQFMLTTASGGSAFGTIDSFSTTGGAPVPALPPLALVALAAGLAGLGARQRRATS